MQTHNKNLKYRISKTRALQGSKRAKFYQKKLFFKKLLSLVIKIYKMKWSTRLRGLEKDTKKVFFEIQMRLFRCWN